MSKNNEKKCGSVAIVGQPNVGKSTLLNHLLGVKLSITSKKPQTTRHSILGINTLESAQIIYVDTPGIHRAGTKAMNRYMNRAALAALHDVDVIVLVIQALIFNQQDQKILQVLIELNKPIVLVINKIDKLKNKSALLPFIESLSTHHAFAAVVPLSAKDRSMVQSFEQSLLAWLPVGEPRYDSDQLTDRSDRFVAAEILREKLMRSLGQELPYETSVTIDAFEEEEHIIRIAAIIWVARDGQKSIVIGKNGVRLKAMSTQARMDMENYFEKKVFLNTWVKVKSGWSDDEQSLNQLGYTG